MKYLRPAIVLTLVYVLLTGLAFPGLITAIAQGIMPHQANGSLIKVGGKVVGSELIGQSFSDPKYIHPRPSAAGAGYDANNSSGTNLGPTNPKLLEGLPDDPSTKDADESYMGFKQYAEAYRKENGVANDVILPTDAVTRSGSGLDPHISPRNAELQANRVAKARGVDVASVMKAIEENTAPSFLGVFGDPTVNVLKVNIALDNLK